MDTRDQDAPAIEQAIRESPLGLDPSRDNKTIFVGLPKLTAEFRENLVKQAKEIGERAKVVFLRQPARRWWLVVVAGKRRAHNAPACKPTSSVLCACVCAHVFTRVRAHVRARALA